MRLDGALADLGVACVPAFTAREALDDGRVVRVLPDWALQGAYQGHAWLMYPPSRYLPPKCRVLVEHLLSAVPSP
ncbi:LysR substrate binding domain protein [compost metagenome]